MSKKYFVDRDGIEHVVDMKEIKNKALLDDGSIVSYDYCCNAGSNPILIQKDYSHFLGRGIIYEINGVRQYYILSKPDYYDFWCVYK